MQRGFTPRRLFVCLLLLVLAWAAAAGAATLTVTWSPNSEDDLAGYRVYYGTSSGTYSGSVTVDNLTNSRQLTALDPSTTYYVAVTAYDWSGNESDKSEERSAATLAAALNTYWRDADSDGYGNAAVSQQAAQCPSGYVTNDDDCDDTRASVHPGAGELCDGLDNDCDGEIDEGFSRTTFYLDADGDGYGDGAESVQACQAPPSYATNGADCDDTDPLVHPGQAETCGDGIDQDCDGADLSCEPTHFTKPPRQMDYLTAQGNVAMCGQAADVGDEVVALDPEGTVCGQFSVSQAGTFGPLYINLDDPETPEDEGLADGDRLTFQVWDAATGIETYAHLEVVSQQGSLYTVNLEGNCQETIPLAAGWNLISFTTDVCFHTGAQPPSAPMLAGVSYQQVASLGEALASIAGDYEVVRGFDAQGAHTYDPASPAYLNDLTYLAPGYGYWIKAARDCQLTLTGGRVSPLAGLSLPAGWNLVGHWGHEVRYVGAEPQVTFAGPPVGPTFYELASADELFPTLEGLYRTISSFDAAGAHTLRSGLPEFINDLRYVGPGYGYWIYLNGQAELSW